MILIALATVLLTISFYQPHLLSDNNTFLRAFVSEQLLATLGFILAVTLASSANLHLELNKIEDATGKSLFVLDARCVAQLIHCLPCLE